MNGRGARVPGQGDRRLRRWGTAIACAAGMLVAMAPGDTRAQAVPGNVALTSQMGGSVSALAGSRRTSTFLSPLRMLRR